MAVFLTTGARSGPFGSRTLRESDIEMERLQMRSTTPAAPQHTRGDGLEKRLIEAAEQGDAVSQCNLGILYANGVDDNGYAVKGNRPQAVRWLLAAAKQGLPRAQIKL